MEEVMTQYNIARNKTVIVDGEQPRGLKNGKKRAGKEMEPKNEKEKKRVKVDEGSQTVKILIKKLPKQKAEKGQAQSKFISSKEDSTTFIQPKWNALQPIKIRPPPEAAQSQGQPSLTELKPRIWTSSREELVALLPDLAGPKCLNGVSWLMYETPMVLLDESTTCFDISPHEDSVTLDLLTTREFTCAWPPGPEKVPDPSASLTVNGVPDGNLTLGETVISSSNKLPKIRRTKKSGPTTVTTPAAGSTNSTKDFKTTRPEQKTSDDVSIDWTPSVPTYGQGKPEPVVGSVSQPYGTGTKALNKPFGDVSLRRGRRTKATGFRKETPEGALIDFSSPSVPNYTVYKPAAGIGDTATRRQHEVFSNSIRSWDPNTIFREQDHSTDAFMSNDPPLQTPEVVNGCSNIPIPTTVLGHQSQGHDLGQAKLVKNQSSTFCTPDAMNKLLTQAIGTFGLQHSPSSYHVEPVSNTCTAAIPVDEVVRTQPPSANIAWNAGPAPQMQNASPIGVKLAPLSALPNNHIIESGLKQLTPPPGKRDCDIPNFQTSLSEVVKARHSTGIPDPAGKERKSKIMNRSNDQLTTHIDPRVDSKLKVEPQATEIVEHTNCASNEAKGEHIRGVKALQDTFIPSTVPEEIQAIIDSYLSGRPVLLVISNKRFFDYWSLRLPEEFGFLMLGYFRILGVQESRVHLNDPVRPLKDSPGSMAGQVKWRFRLRWSPGGEEWILPKHDKDLLEHPWWKPPLPLFTPPLEVQITSLDTQSTDNPIINHAAPDVSQEIPAAEPFTLPRVVPNFESQPAGNKDRTVPFEPESTFDTTPRYRAARLSNVNYEFRHAHLRELYHSHVPLQLLAPYGRFVLDSSFPRGWLCEACGKMNFQAALRHRTCSSSFCKDAKPETAPYAIELIFMRDPQDNLSMVLPYNEPLLINLVDTWEDGTRTLPYYIHDDENIFIKHIFTRNLPSLQIEATRLLHLIQIEVTLVRPIDGNSPYFQYSAHAPKDDPSPTTSEWPNVPLCIHHAKDWTQHQAFWFGELKKEQLLINHLSLLAWVTSGTKRGPAIIRAKEKCVVFHAFGCNITVMVTPLSVGVVDLDSLIPMDDLPPDEPDVVPGWIAGLDQEADEVEDPSQEDKESWPTINSKKASNSKRPFLFTLVHGDVLVFYGDDFEYSLKRAGTSFLLIASYQNEP